MKHRFANWLDTQHTKFQCWLRGYKPHQKLQFGNWVEIEDSAFAEEAKSLLKKAKLDSDILLARFGVAEVGETNWYVKPPDPLGHSSMGYKGNYYADGLPDFAIKGLIERDAD